MTTRSFDTVLDSFIKEHDAEFKALLRTLPDAPKKDTSELFRKAVDAILTTPMWMLPAREGGRKRKWTMRERWDLHPYPDLQPWDVLAGCAKELLVVAFGPKTISCRELTQTGARLSKAVAFLAVHDDPLVDEAGKEVQTFDLRLWGEIILTSENIRRTLERAILRVNEQLADRHTSLANRRTRYYLAPLLQILSEAVHARESRYTGPPTNEPQARVPKSRYGSLSENSMADLVAALLRKIGVKTKADPIRKALSRKKTHL